MANFVLEGHNLSSKIRTDFQSIAVSHLWPVQKLVLHPSIMSKKFGIDFPVLDVRKYVVTLSTYCRRTWGPRWRWAGVRWCWSAARWSRCTAPRGRTSWATRTPGCYTTCTSPSAQHSTSLHWTVWKTHENLSFTTTSISYKSLIYWGPSF